MAYDKTCNKGDNMERLAYLIMIGMMILLIAVVFAVLGKGEYKPPPPKEQGSISNHALTANQTPPV
jgi:hypothetical protein